MSICNITLISLMDGGMQYAGIRLNSDECYCGGWKTSSRVINVCGIATKLVTLSILFGVTGTIICAIKIAVFKLAIVIFSADSLFGHTIYCYTNLYCRHCRPEQRWITCSDKSTLANTMELHYVSKLIKSHTMVPDIMNAMVSICSNISDIDEMHHEFSIHDDNFIWQTIPSWPFCIQVVYQNATSTPLGSCVSVLKFHITLEFYFTLPK